MMKKLLITPFLIIYFLLANADPFDEQWEKRYDTIAHDACKNIVNECLVQFSAYQQDNNGLPINNLDDIAISGKVVIVATHDAVWGEGKNYQSDVVESPTWRSLVELANEMIITTGDRHHIFLEDFEIIDVVNDVQFVVFYMGS